jgi:hypothetical protein
MPFEFRCPGQGEFAELGKKRDQLHHFVLIRTLGMSTPTLTPTPRHHVA